MFRNIKMFSKAFRNIPTCLVDCPVVRMFRNFQFIPKHAYLFGQHFKNVLENFEDCSETFRSVFRTFQKCSETLRCFQKCSEIFRLISRLSCFHNVSKLLVYSAILRFVLKIYSETFILFWKYFKKCSRTFRCSKKKVFLEHSDLISRLFCFQSVLKLSILFWYIQICLETFQIIPKMFQILQNIQMSVVIKIVPEQFWMWTCQNNHICFANILVS